VSEVGRIVEEYRRRAVEIPAQRYSPASFAQVFQRQTREWHTLCLLDEAEALPLAGKRVLDIGCGSGAWLAEFEGWGVPRERLYGIDLLDERVTAARRRLGCLAGPEGASAGADIRRGDATALPWVSESFDIVTQSMVFSSILDPAMRRGVASEMARVAAPSGVIVWYDFALTNPHNPHLRRVTRSELRRLFPGFEVASVRTTLAQPLTRRFVRHARAAAVFLEHLRFLNSHTLALLTRAPTEAG